MSYDTGPGGWWSAGRPDHWWKPKASNILSVVYWVILITVRPFAAVAWLFVPALCTITGIGFFGHFLNDYFDISTDRAAGKSNSMGALPRRNRVLLLAGALCMALLPWIFLPADRLTFLLLTLELTTLLIYAAPPLRAKERIVWPILLDGAYAYAIPALLAVHTFLLPPGGLTAPWMALILFAWQMGLGCRHYLNHLAMDGVNDRRAGIPTLATRRGNAFIRRLTNNYVLPVELFSLAALLYFTGRASLPPVLTAVAAWLLLYAIPNAFTSDGYALMTGRFTGMDLDRFYQEELPLIPLCFLAVHDRRYLILLAVHILLFRPSFYRRVYGRCLSFLWYLLFPFLSSVKRLLSIRRRRKGNPPAIVLANINKGKYSETFINELLPRLKYPIHLWYGGEMPDRYRRPDGLDRSFLPDEESLRRGLSLLESVLKGRDYLRHRLCNYLQHHRIGVVLAEFGAVGASLYPITRDTGTPLVVYFHGYDVYNLQQLERQAARYPGLFREACRIIAVSEEMICRLAEMGAPREKLIHLPAFVNLDLFPYTDRSGFPPRFLCVGRFTETKSPHLTLLAFHKVAQRLPGASLTMVGRGGGGELFEACIILARALGIERKVIFRGTLSHAETAREMEQARVFVQHSVTTPEQQDKEGKPVAVMEAMAAGLPIVSTRHSGITELIRDGETGILVDEYDTEAMAMAMLLLAEDDGMVLRLGRCASAHIHQHPLVARHIELLEAIIDECLEE